MALSLFFFLTTLSNSHSSILKPKQIIVLAGNPEIEIRKLGFPPIPRGKNRAKSFYFTFSDFISFLPIPQMGHFSFQRGNQVEVCSRLDGFMSSYYEATVVANMGTNYLIQYKNLVEEFNDSVPLKKTIKAAEVRPLPQEIREVDAVFHVGGRIDAYDLNGWWVRTISLEENGSGHQSMFFETTGQELDYLILKLMVHQDWRNGKWVSSKKTKRNVVQ